MMRRRLTRAWLVALLGASVAHSTPAELAWHDATVAELQAAMGRGDVTAETLTAMYLARIAAFDQQGPKINAFITLDRRALASARALDAERRAGKLRGPLHGIPVVLKDNLDTADLPTTAGCSLLAGSIPPDDAFVVRRLREAGALIIGKANLDEFAANGGAPNGYSSMGGQTRNPHDPTRSPGGSSAGTAAAVAAAFAQVGLGTDTSLSVRGPASFNGIVGLRPTAGLVSRDGVVPLSPTFDTVGPLTRSVRDAAVVLSVIAGYDRADGTTEAAKARSEGDYERFLTLGGLAGARIGVVRAFAGRSAATDRVFEGSLAQLRALGATLVDPLDLPGYVLGAKSSLYMTIRTTEFAASIDAYLATLKPRYPRTLAALVTRAEALGPHYRNPPKLRNLRENLRAPGPDDPVYIAAKNEGRALLRAAMRALLAKYELDALVYASSPAPAGAVEDLPKPLRESLLDLAPQIGYPELVVPAGMTEEGMPVTISLLSAPFSEARLLGFGYAFEQRVKARVLPRHTPALSGKQ